MGYASLAVGSALLAVPLVPGVPFLPLSSYWFAKPTILKPPDVSADGESLPNARE